MTHFIWKKVPLLILWKPLCLCPCVKRLQLLPLARILAKYWWLPVETRPVKTIWEERSFSGDDSRAKQNHRQCGGIRTQPNLPTSRARREHQKEEGNRQIVSKKKKRRGQRVQGEDREDVETEICTAWLGLSTLQRYVMMHRSHLVQLSFEIADVHKGRSLFPVLLTMGCTAAEISHFSFGLITSLYLSHVELFLCHALHFSNVQCVK